MKIGNKEIGNDHCFIIAEAGVSHNGDIELAKKLVDAAVESGVDAVKFQTFKSEKIVTPDADQATYQKKNIGKDESQFQMLKRLELLYEDFRELKAYCDKKGIIFLSTPHSCEEDIDFLDELGVVAFKVGSGDLTNIPTLEYIAKKGKPVILSTGMATMDEVKEAVEAVTKYNKDLIILHCTTNYPCPLDEVNLKAMKTMEKEFSYPVGYSDHTMGIDVSLLAVSMGALMIEKHFTLDRNMEGPDHAASLEPHELKEMVEKIKNKPSLDIMLKEIADSETILGDGIKKPNISEQVIAKVARKSITADKDIPTGTTITRNMLHIKRPEGGIRPKYINKVIGKKAKKDIKKDELFSFEDLV